jgi:methionyl-tRNA synthetase
MAKYYLTSAIPYVNARPHIGWALEIVQTDTIARFRKLLGDDVRYLCGSDENSLKNVQAAEKAGKPVQQFVDEYSQFFIELAKNVDVSFDVFQRGSNPNHHKSAQALWQRCADNGDIYKKAYTGLYCVGCEMFYTRDELNENGECFEHPGKKLDEVTEENYFFRLSAYKEQLIKLIESHELEITPEHRKNEVLSFLKGTIEDISISRSNERAKNWGVTVPGDDTQKMYVWFDALNIYQSGVGFGTDEETYKKWWPADIHAIGKGIIRFHAVYWPAFLISAKLPLPKKLFVHEYITVNGQKMSKTLGNVIDPNEYITQYGTDAVRYYLLAKISPFQDGDFSDEKFKLAYNADLANGLGNLAARVARLCETVNLVYEGEVKQFDSVLAKHEAFRKTLEEGKFNEALGLLWVKISAADKYINEEQPWVLVKSDVAKAKEVLTRCVNEIQEISLLLQPFLPKTAATLHDQFKGPKIVSGQPLFPRL